MKSWQIGILIMALPLFGCSPNYPNAPVDPLFMARSTSSNDALYCPPGACTDTSGESAVFAVTPQELFQAWQTVISGQPRASVIATDPKKHLIHAEQRSLIFRFVDTILIRVEPVDEGISYIALSRSELGKSDLGVNAKRLQAWTEQLNRVVAGE